jgi:DNA-3-methyladenine glycosylase II
VAEFEIRPRGPFSLAAAQGFAGGFAAGIGGGEVGETSIVMSFPVEGWQSSAAVELRQRPDGVVIGRTDASEAQVPAIAWQAARCLSLDHDGTDWPAVGERDPVMGRAQRTYHYLRPVCFYSAYEAATSFVIGQRISRRQSARVKAGLSRLAGDEPTVDGRAYAAFPRPQRLLDLKEIPGLSAQKTTWLQGLARAALDGRLDSEIIRTQPRDESLAALQDLPGVGPFTAEGIRLRGCGVVDEIPEAEEISVRAAADLYDRPALDRSGYADLADAWRPYRMWAVVLLRVAWERGSGGRRSYRSAE